MSLPSKTTAPALFVDQACNYKIIHDVPVPELVAGEVVVKVSFSGVNPSDIKHAPHLGVRSTVMGYDFSGHVVGANPGSPFKAADVVAGHTPTGVGKPWKYGAHQEYLACPEELLFKVPTNLPSDHAAALTTVVATAADGLYSIFNHPLPGEQPAAGLTPGPLLIWGASTSVGLCMLQLARASGASPIFVAASPKRHALLQKLGATRCFDYAAADEVSAIEAAVAEAGAGPIAYAADCAGSMGEDSSAEQMLRCVGADASVLSVVGGKNKRLKMPLASANSPVKLAFGDGQTVEIPARPEAAAKMRKSMHWTVDNYGSKFELPVVDVFKGEAEKALEEVKKVAVLGKFGQLVLGHPLS